MREGTQLLLGGLPAAEAAWAMDVLLSAPSIELGAGTPDLLWQPGSGALLVVGDGFVVLGATAPPLPRWVVTAEATAGDVLLPPAPSEVLSALEPTRLTELSAQLVERLSSMPSVARALVEQLAVGLRQRQEAMEIFAE